MDSCLHTAEAVLSSPTNLALFAATISVFTLFVNAYTFWIVYNLVYDVPRMINLYITTYDKGKERMRKEELAREAKAAKERARQASVVGNEIDAGPTHQLHEKEKQEETEDDSLSSSV